MDRRSVLESLKRTGPEIVAYFEAEEELLKRRYAPDKWTVRQLLVHLTDAEFMYLGRVFAGLAESGARVEGFDQDAWVKELHYDKRSLRVCRVLFDGAREALIDVLGHTKDEALDHTVIHSERGTMTVRDLLRYHTWHSEHHLEQIDAAREGKTWEPPAEE